jgi:hypothetical protein
MIVALALFVPASLVIFLPLNAFVGLGVGIALWLGSLGVLWSLAPVISLDTRQFRAGRARISITNISAMEIFRGEDARTERGTSLDARAWLVMRPWLDAVVKVTLDDPLDPTPYWLVSSARPEELVSAWQRARTS